MKVPIFIITLRLPAVNKAAHSDRLRKRILVGLTLLGCLFVFRPLFAELTEFQRLSQQSAGYVRQGDWNRARPLLDKQAELQPYNENVLFHLSLALMYQRTENADEYRQGLLRARTLLEKCVEMHTNVDPDSVALSRRWFYLGLVQRYLGQPRQALHAFRKSFAVDPTFRAALYNEYILQLESGHLREAESIQARYNRLFVRPGTPAQ